MMKRRNGEIVVKRSSRYAKRPTKSYTGEHFLSSNYGTVLKMLTLFCIVLFGDYCLGNFRLEYIWPLWLCMNSLMDAYKMQGLGFAVFFIGIVITSDIICFLLVPVRVLFLVASSYVWLQYVVSSERGLCIQTVVLWVLFVYVESCIRVRELNRYLGSPSSSTMLFDPSPSVSLWPDSGGDGTSPPDSLTSRLLVLNGTAEAAGAGIMQQNDMAISAAAAASSVASASSSTLSRIRADGANDSSSATSPWVLWSLITSATPGFFGSSLPLRLELCRPLAAHCTGYPIITLTRALKSFIAYRVKRRRQRQFAKENQQLKDLLFHALPDDVQQKQRSQLFSTFSLASSQPSSLPANSNSTTLSSGYTSMQQPPFPSSSTSATQLVLSNGPGAASLLTSGAHNNAWLANNNGYSGGGLSDLPNNSSAGLSCGDALGLSTTNTLHKSSSSGGFNSSGAPTGSAPTHQRATCSSSYLSTHELVTPVSAYAGNSDTWNSWTTPTYTSNTTSLDDGVSSSSWLTSNKGGCGGAFQLRGSKQAAASTSSSSTLRGLSSSKSQQRSVNGRNSTAASGGSGSKNSATSMSYKSTSNSSSSSSKLQTDANKQPSGSTASASGSSAFADGSLTPPNPTAIQRPKPQPQFAIIAKLFSVIGSVLFSSPSSSKSTSPSRRGSVTLLPPAATSAKSADVTNSSTATKTRQKNFDLLENDNDDNDDSVADHHRSRHGQHLRRRTTNKPSSSATAHSSRSSSNSRSSGGSFVEAERDTYAGDSSRREPSSSNAGSSDNEFVAADEDDGLLIRRRTETDDVNDAVYETATAPAGGGDAASFADGRKSAAAEHVAPPSYESLVMGGGGDASSAGLTMMNGDKMAVAKNSNGDAAKTGSGGRRRRAMTASSPTNTTSTSTAEQSVAEQHPSTPSSQSATITQQNSGVNAGRLEAEHKRLKNDLLESRQTEQDLRSQLSKVNIDQQSLRSDNVLLQKQNDSLQQRLHEMGSTRTREKKDAGAMEKKLAEETKKRADAEKQLERERRAHAKDLEDSHKRETEVEKMRSKLTESEQDLLQIRQELKAKDDEARKYLEENRRLEQYRSAQKDTDVLLSALSAMQDKNMHMENSLTAETKLKLELFTALGDAKKDLDQYKTLVFKRENEIKDLKETIKRLTAQAAVAAVPQQPKQQQISSSSIMPTSSTSSSMVSNSTSLADVLSNGFSSGLLSNGTSKSHNMARLNSLSVLDGHKFGMGDSLASTLGQHFGGNVGVGSSASGSNHHLHHHHQLHNHHQQTLNDALASFGSTSSSSPGFLHEYTSGGNSTPPMGSQGGNNGGVNGLLFGELGYGSHLGNNNNPHSYYAAAVQGGGGSSANRSTPSPSSVPGSAAAAAALQGGNGMRSSPSISNNNNNMNGSDGMGGSSSNFSRW